MSEQELLTVAEVAKRLKIGPTTIRRWLREGRLHGMLIGGKRMGYRIPANEVERLLHEKAS